MKTRLMMLTVLGAAVALSACNRADSDWNKATAANTLAAYQAFVQQHGSDQRADNARGRILALQDEQAWAVARAANTIESYNAYLQTESGGVHAGQAQYNLTALHRAQDWQAIENDASAASLQTFLLKYPQGPEANQARTKLGALNYRLQLANSRTQAGAERKRAQLAAKFGKVLDEIVVVAPASPHAMFRVTSGPMSQATANSACAVLERAHQSCKLIADAGTPG